MVIYKATHNCGRVSVGDYVTLDVQLKPKLGDLALFDIKQPYIAYVTRQNQSDALGTVTFVTPPED